MWPMADHHVVRLYGDDHPSLDELATACLDETTAIALSRGRYPKVDPHPDPNEDGAVAAAGPAGWLLAVADGHLGFDAARAALEVIADGAGTLLAGPPKPLRLHALCEDAAAAAEDAAARASEPREASDTALSVVTVSGSWMLVASYGDTVVARLRGRRSKVLTHPEAFLRLAVDPPRVTRVRLRRGDRVVVVSDGVVDFLGQDWPARLARLTRDESDPVRAVRALPSAAMDGGAGDHLAAALLIHPGRQSNYSTLVPEPGGQP